MVTKYPANRRTTTRSSLAAAVLTGIAVALSPLASALPASAAEGTVYRYEYPSIASDTFTRTTTSGWGTADQGGAWTVNSASAFGVAGGAGTLTVPRAGSTLSANLLGVSSTDTDLTATVVADKGQTGSGTHLTFAGRLVGSLQYGAKVRLLANGTATLATVDGSASGTAVTLPGTFGAGDAVSVRLQVTGTAPTTVRAKAWAAGSSEPAEWTVTTTSATAGLQTAGAVGLSAYVSGSATNAPLAFTYDDLSVRAATPKAIPNAVPTAAISTSVDDLTASLDGSASADTDGTIHSYAWDLGDGTTSTSAAPEHTYRTAGSYPVTLKVTDNDGSTGTATSTVTVTAPVPPVGTTVLARDAFGTARSNGWGTATTGGAWTHLGSTASYSVASGAAKQVISAAGATRISSLTGVQATASDTTVSVTLDKTIAGAAAQIAVVGRVVGTDGYSARVKYQTDGTAQLSLMEGGTALATTSLGTVAAKSAQQVRVQVVGTAPTTVRAKLWKSGTTEPTDWQLTATGSNATYQKAGSVALNAYLAGSATVAPLTVSFRDLTVKGTAADTGAGTSPVETDPTSVGVPTGTKMTKVVNGNVTVTEDNTVIDKWDIHGYVTIKAKNVVIRNSYIRGTDVPAKNDLLRVQGDGYSVTVESSTLKASTRTPDQDGVKGWNFTLRRVDISDVVDPVHIHGSNVLIENSRLHDNAHFLEDPNWGGTPSHSDSIQLQKGTNITIRDNEISGAGNAALMLTQDAGTVSDVTLTGNRIDGGACSINIKNTTTAPKGVTIADNTFGRGQIYKNCAVRVPTAFPLDMRGNAWVDGGTVARTNI